MNCLNKFKRVIVALILVQASVLAGLAVETPEVKSLLQQALKLYSDHQYVRALDLFKQAQSLDPDNATADEYIKNTKQRILEWELQGQQEPDNNQKSATWDSLMKGSPAETATNAKDIIAARRSLVERMRNRSTNTDNIVQIQDNAKGLDIVLFHDHLFLPGLQTLRDEALPILANVAQMIRTGGDRQINVMSVSHTESQDPNLLFPQFALPAADPDLPQTRSVDSAAMFQDLESTRAFILFTYLAQKGFEKADARVSE